ncbi:MAG: ABC transporter permease [Chloroflexi bacterium]|nr:ABC transporter permease [Chloroflexota bacterium]
MTENLVPLGETVFEQPGVFERAKRWLFQTQEGVIFIIVLLLAILLSVLSPVFLTQRNIGVLLSQVSMTAIAAYGMTLLIITGEVDLSVGSLQAFVGVITMQVLNQTGNLAIGLAIGLALGVIVGLVNAGITLKLGINSLIVTLAMFSILRGAAYISTKAAVQNTHDLASFSSLGNGFVGFIPWPVLLMIVVFAILYVIMSRTTFGRYVYAVGGNSRAAHLSGIKVQAIKTICFALAAGLAALSAIILISRMNSGQNNAGFGFELQVIGAVLLGGTSLQGGEGSLVGTFFAVLLLGILNNGIILLGIDSSWQIAVNGVLIVLAIYIDARRRRAMGTV